MIFVWGWVFFFIFFIIALLWAVKRQQRIEWNKFEEHNPTFELNFTKVALVETVRAIKFNAVTKTEEMVLSKFSQFFTFPNDKLLTLEFELSKQNPNRDFFEIKNVILHSDGKDSTAQRILLIEKVPDYVAPPNGCRYFDHAYYRPFCLKESYPSQFLIDAAFNKSIHSLRTSDHVTIQIELYNIDTSSQEKQECKTIEFRQSLSQLISKDVIEFKIDLMNICRE